MTENYTDLLVLAKHEVGFVGTVFVAMFVTLVIIMMVFSMEQAHVACRGRYSPGRGTLLSRV